MCVVHLNTTEYKQWIMRKCDLQASPCAEAILNAINPEDSLAVQDGLDDLATTQLKPFEHGGDLRRKGR